MAHADWGGTAEASCGHQIFIPVDGEEPQGKPAVEIQDSVTCGNAAENQFQRKGQELCAEGEKYSWLQITAENQKIATMLQFVKGILNK